jgi:hypothetical protein
VPGGLDDACNSLVLQRRRGRELLRKQRLVTMLLVWVHTSDGGRLRDAATRLTVLIDRLIEQDEVLLMWRQIQVLELLLLRG